MLKKNYFADREPRADTRPAIPMDECFQCRPTLTNELFFAPLMGSLLSRTSFRGVFLRYSLIMCNKIKLSPIASVWTNVRFPHLTISSHKRGQLE